MMQAKRKFATQFKDGDKLLFKGCQWSYFAGVNRWYPVTKPSWLPTIFLSTDGWVAGVNGVHGSTPVEAVKKWVSLNIRERVIQRDKYKRRTSRLQKEIDTFKARLWK